MLDGLRHGAVVRGDDEQDEVDSSDPAEHVVDESLVTWNVDESDGFGRFHRQVREPEVDGHPALLLLREAVRIDAGEGLDEERLAMIDVTGGGDDHRSAISDRPRSASCARNTASSSRHRKSKMSAPSCSRPITGTGRLRNTAASRSRAAPEPRFPVDGRMAKPALGIVCVGSAPLPIWLSHSITSTDAKSCSLPATGASDLSAALRIVSSERVRARSAGRRSTKRSGLAYSLKTADSAAIVILPGRSARFIGFRLIFFTRSARPRIIPAWGPPRSLSPLKVTRSAPVASDSEGVGS